MDERWRLMEQFESIAMYAPVSAGDLISRSEEKALRTAGLVKRRGRNAEVVLTLKGLCLWYWWSRVVNPYVDPDEEPEEDGDG